MAQPDLEVAITKFRSLLSSSQDAQLVSFSSRTPNAEDVVELMDSIVTANASRKSRIFASRLQGLLGCIQQYCSIVNTCAGPNQIAALVWGSIKLVLLISANFAEYFEKLSERVAQLSTYCPRLAEYEQLFPDSPRLQQALSEVYAVVVVFCTKSLGVVQEKGIKRFSKSIWKSFKVDFKEIEENLSEAKNEVTEELKLASEQAAHGFRRLLITEIEENRMMRQKQMSYMTENSQFRTQVALDSKEIQDRRNQEIINQEARQRIRLLQRIPNYDYANTLRRVRYSRCEGTCHWFIDRQEFHDWTDESKISHFWCYGIPGSGKTVLMGFVIDYLKRASFGKDATLVVYYFFDSSNKKSLNSSTFLRCILHQAIKLERLDPSACRRLEGLFDDHTKQTEPDPRELKDAVIDIFSKFKNTYVVLDGLDEAPKSDQREVNSFLIRLQKLNGLRILAFSHPDIDMSKILDSCYTLQIRPEHLEGDIEVFVEAKIAEHLDQELSVCSPSQLDQVKKVLLSGAEEMFLWVEHLFVAIVEACEEDGTPESIPDLFEKPPRTVADLYTLALIKLLKAGVEMVERANKALQWVVCSQRPLNVGELEEAISITADQKSWRRSSFKLSPAKLCRMCGNLVKFDAANETISLAHHTVLTFLSGSSIAYEASDFRIDEGEVERYLFDVCLTYMSFTDFQKALARTSDTSNAHILNQPAWLLTGIAPQTFRPWALRPLLSNKSGRATKHFDLVHALRSEMSSSQTASTDPSFVLLGYCKTYWHAHARYIESEDLKRVRALKSFVLGTLFPSEWKPWSSHADPGYLPHYGVFLWSVMEAHLPIYSITVSSQEVGYWTQLWSNGEGLKLFTSACKTSNLRTLGMILEPHAGKSYTYCWSTRRPTLQELRSHLTEACYEGRIGVVDLLLRLESQIGSIDTQYRRTLLPIAAGQGHLALVERLLQKGFNPNFKDAGGDTALHKAAVGGHLAVVELLLQKGADFEEGNDEETPLLGAVAGGHLAVVERLLQEGANVSPQWSSGESALCIAAGSGYAAISELLIEKGADINSGSGMETPLHRALVLSRADTVELLLRHGAEVNCTEQTGKALLRGAAGMGSLALVERVLQQWTPDDFGPELVLAMPEGHLAVVERFLQEKIEPQYLEKAQYLAVQWGHSLVATRLRKELER